MCGRYAASAGAEEVVEAFGPAEDQTSGLLRPTWNAAPTQARAVVLERAPLDGEPARQVRLLTWGLVPSWSRDGSRGAAMINARSETVLERPAYRRAAAARRCLVPASGWYEWQPPERAAGRVAQEAGGAASPAPRKQPFLISRADGEQLALAGVYEFWRRPDVASGSDDAAGSGDGSTPDPWFVTFAVLTREVESGPLSEVHDRMPLVLDRGAWDAWLDPGVTDPAAVAVQVDAARAVRPGRFTAVPVGRRVGNVRQDDAALLDPVGPPLSG